MMKKKNFKFNLSLLIFISCSLFLIMLVGSISYNLVYNNYLLDAGLFNGTNSTHLGISLIFNSTQYLNFSGDFISKVFLNTTANNWDIRLSIADTYSSRSGITTSSGINLSYPSLVSYWSLDSNNGTFFADAKRINNGTATITDAVGGVITTDGAYNVHTFTSNGTFVVYGTITVEVLVVAGGGSGGGADISAFGGSAGGGGAGGLIYNSSYVITAGSYDIVVGSGGGLASFGSAGNSGSNSSFDTLIAVGGGGGGWKDTSGKNGGSGGGDPVGTASPGSGTAGQGYDGGTSSASAPNYGSSGGGGASGIGGNGTDTVGGAGGNGTNYTINGSNVYYAGGGGGGVYGDSVAGNATSGGGNGGSALLSRDGGNGTDGLGGGGGGGGGNDADRNGKGGKGGSGIVIIRYLYGSLPGLTNATGISSKAINFNRVSHSINLSLTSLNISQSWWAKNTAGDINWHHYVNSSGTYYKDGTIVAAANIQNIFNVSGNIFIGFNTTSTYFNGSIDEVLIYSAALTAAEVTSLYKAGLSLHANTNITLQTRTANNYNISDKSLIAFIPFNNDSIGDNETYATDKLGVNNATFFTTFAKYNHTGVVSQSLDLNQDGGAYALMNNNTAFNFLNKNFTFSWWEYRTDSSSITLCRDPTTSFVGFILAYSSPPQIYMSSDGASWDIASGKSLGVTRLRQWTHYVVTRNGTTFRAYQDGLQTDTWTSSLSLFTGADGISIGKCQGSSSYRGNIDELRIYNRSVNYTEVQNLYQLGNYHISDWSAWTNESIVQDSISQRTLVSSKFMQYKTLFYTNETGVSPYLLNHSVLKLEGISPNATLMAPLNNTIFANGTAVNFTANLTDDSSGIKNATLWIYNSSGLFNQNYVPTGVPGFAVKFNGINTSITLANMRTYSRVTITAWFNNTGSTGGDVFSQTSVGATCGSDTIQSNTNAKGELCFSNGVYSGAVLTGVNTKDSQWHFMAVSWNGSNVVVYLDGVYKAKSGNFSSNYTITLNQTNSQKIGSYFSTALPFNGTIDEVVIWNRSLSSTEISDLYAGGAGVYGNPSTAPFNSGLVAGWHLDETSGLIASDFSGNGINGTLTTSTSWVTGKISNITFSANTLIATIGIVVTLIEGIYNWFYSLFDWAGNSFVTGNNTLTIDTTYPLINFGIGTLNSGINVSQSNIYVNVSAFDTNEANITFKLYNSSGAVNISTYNAGVRVINWTSLANGVYYYNVTLTDLALNVNSTATRTITLDTTAPNGTLIAPSNNTYTNVTSQNFTANLSDNLGIKNATLYVYNSSGLFNQTFLTGYAAGTLTTRVGVVVTLIDGIYNWFYSLFDWAENSFVTTNNTLTVDTTYPQINFVSPTSDNGINVSRNYIETNISVTDVNENASAIRLYNGSRTLIDTYDCSGLSCEYPYDPSMVLWMHLEIQSYYGENATKFYDFSGNGNNGSCSGTACPTFNSSGKLGGAMNFDGGDFINVTDSSSLQSQNITVSVWIKGGTQLASARIIEKGYNSGPQFSSFNLRACNNEAGCGGNSSYASFDIGYSGDFSSVGGVRSPWDNNWHHLVGTYNGTMQSFYMDGVLLNSKSIIQTILYNSQPLQIGKYVRANSFYFNGAIDEVAIYNRSLSASEILALYNGSIAKYKNWSNLADGVYYYNASASDLAGNLNNTETRQITLDTHAPNATLNTPANGTYFANGTALNFTANLSDNLGIKNATLFVYNSSGLFNQTFYGEIAVGTLTTTVGVVVTLIDGIYNWFYSLFDWAENSFVSQNGTVIIDTIYPVPIFTDPTPDNNTGRTSNFTINVSITEINFANITLNWNGTSTTFNSTNNSVYAVSGGYVFTYLQTGLINGVTYYYRLNITDLANNKNSTELRLVKGNSAPSFINITHFPNTNATIDPGTQMLFTLNISDTDLNLNGSRNDTAVLQWKNSSQGWGINNISMTNQTIINSTYLYVLFNATFNLPAYEDTINYRIVAKDELGEIGISAIYVLASYWDCTWNIVPIEGDLGTRGGFYSETQIGTVEINNTGDIQYITNNCSVVFNGWVDYTNFTATYYSRSSWPSSSRGLKFYFNSTEVTNLTINVSENKTLVVKGIYPSSATVFEEKPYFTLSSSVNNTATGSSKQNITMKMVISPGAYLETGVEPSSQTVYLTPGNFYIAPYAKDVVAAVDNINNTAYNVILNASLDATLTSLFVSGDLNKSIINMTTIAKNYSNLTFTLTAANIVDLAITSHIITSFASGYENSSGNLSLIVHSGNSNVLNSSGTVTFACYVTSDSVCVSACINTTAGLVYDPDCTLPTTTTIVTTTTTTSGGGGGAAGGGGAVEKSEATFELLRGEEQAFDFEVKNKYPYPMKNVKMVISGINAEYVSLEPDHFDYIAEKSSRIVKVKINAPAYFTGKTYRLVIDIEGELLVANATSGTKIAERKILSLYILEVSRNDSTLMANDSLKYLEEMNVSGLNTKEIANLVQQLGEAYANIDFAAVKNLYEKISTIYENAMESKGIIEELTFNIEQMEREGINVDETKKMLYLAETAFNRGDYALALTRLKEAQLTYALEVKGEFNAAFYVKNHPLPSLGIILGIGLLGLGSSLVIRFNYYRRKLRLLKEEEILLLELMKVVQRECFEGNKMSMEEYEQAINQYESRLSEVIAEKIRVETKLANMLKIKGKRQALDEEKKKLVSLIKEAQNDYLNKGKIETRVYENMVKSYMRKLTEVQEEIANMEAEQALNNSKTIKSQVKK